MAMPILKDEDRKEVSEQLAGLSGAVRLVMFTQDFECHYCAETRELVQEIASLSDKVDAVVYDFVADKQEADAYRIDKIPAIAVVGGKDYGVRLYGVPSGYEFVSLMEAIQVVSSGQSELSEVTREALAKMTDPVHLQVFVTPT
jgi:glutaredoxin-like protein